MKRALALAAALAVLGFPAGYMAARYLEKRDRELANVGELR